VLGRSLAPHSAGAAGPPCGAGPTGAPAPRPRAAVPVPLDCRRPAAGP